MTNYKPRRGSASLEQLSKIVELSDNSRNSRPQIAKVVGLSKVSVFKYQKLLRLV